jgi:hypothetical protein
MMGLVCVIEILGKEMWEQNKTFSLLRERKREREGHGHFTACVNSSSLSSADDNSSSAR